MRRQFLRIYIGMAIVLFRGAIATTFIVNRREKYTGWDEEALTDILDRHLAEKTAA